MLKSLRKFQHEFSNFFSTHTKAALIFLAFAVMGYLPAFLLDFGIHNDYYFQNLIDRNNFWMGFPESVALARMGRLINSIIISIQFQFINSISDLAVARLASFAVAYLGCLVLAYIFIKRLKMDGLVSFLVVICILALPGFQIYILWITNFSNALSFLLGIVAYLIWDYAREEKKLSENLIFIAVSQAVLLLSFMTYPANTFSFLLPTLARTLFSGLPLRDIRTKALYDAGFIFLGAVVYYILFRYIIAPALVMVNPDYWRMVFDFKEGHYSFNITLDPIEKILTFVRLSKLAIAGPWHVVFGDLIYLHHITFLAGGIFTLIILMLKKININSVVQRVSIIIACIIVINLPYVAVGDVPSAYRITLVYSAIILIIDFWIIEMIGYTLKDALARHARGIIMVMITVMQVLVASRNILNASLDKNMELNYLRSELGSEDISSHGSITVIGAPMLSNYINRSLTLDFNIGCSQMYYMYCDSQIYAVLSEMGVSRPIPVRHIPYSPDNVIKSTPIVINDDDNTFIIDYNRMRVDKSVDFSMMVMQARTQKSSRAFYERNFGKIDETRLSEWDKKYVVKKANIIKVKRYSGQGDYLRWVTYSYQMPQAKLVYSIGPADNYAVGAMPRNWRLLGSNNGIDWDLLDKRERQGGWKVGEMMTYSIKEPHEYRIYLFRFPDVDKQFNLANVRISF